MCDQKCDIDLVLLDQIQCARVDCRSTITLKPIRRTNRTHQHGFFEKDAAQHAQICSSMTVAVTQNRRLLPNQPRHRSEYLARPRCLDQILNTLTPCMLVDQFTQTCSNRIDRFISANFLCELPLALIWIADKQQSLVHEHVSEILCE